MSNSSLVIQPIIILQYFSIEYLCESFTNESLNYKLLKQKKIIPDNWQVSNSSQAIGNSKLSLTNGIEIIKQNAVITFSEPLNKNVCENSRITNIAYKYFLDDFLLSPKTIYIKFKTFVKFEIDSGVERKAIEDYILSKLTPCNSQDSQFQPYQIDLNYFFKIDRASIKFNIQKSELLLPNNQKIPTLMFSGIIPYNIQSSSEEEIKNIIFSWERDYSTYISILKEFLS